MDDWNRNQRQNNLDKIKEQMRIAREKRQKKKAEEEAKKVKEENKSAENA